MLLPKCYLVLTETSPYPAPWCEPAFKRHDIGHYGTVITTSTLRFMKHELHSISKLYFYNFHCFESSYYSSIVCVSIKKNNVWEEKKHVRRPICLQFIVFFAELGRRSCYMHITSTKEANTASLFSKFCLQMSLM
jgi:hypothetical protein